MFTRPPRGNTILYSADGHLIAIQKLRLDSKVGQIESIRLHGIGGQIHADNLGFIAGIGNKEVGPAFAAAIFFDGPTEIQPSRQILVGPGQLDLQSGNPGQSPGR